MASKVPKVRLVRCPKCMKLLPEVANVPVYQCGGCGLTLKAKKRKEDEEGESSEALVQNNVQKIEPENAFEDEELTSSSQKEFMSSKEGCQQVEYQDFAKEKSARRSISNGITSSSELNWHEKEELSSVARGSREANGSHGKGSDLENSSPDSQGIARGSKFTSAEKPYVESVPLKFASSYSEELKISERIVRRYADLIGSRSPVKSAEPTDDSILSEGDMIGNKLRGKLGISEPTAVNSFHAYDGSVSSSDSWTDQASDYYSLQSKLSFTQSQKIMELISTNKEGIVNDKDGTKSEVQFVRSRGPVNTAEVTDDSIISEDYTLGNKLTGRSGVSKSPADNNFHAYDGSVSSSDSWGDQVSDFRSHQSKMSFSGSEKLAELISPNKEDKREEIPVDDKVGTESEVENQENKSLTSVNEKHGPVVDRVSLDQDELPEYERYSIQVHDQVNARDSTVLNPIQSSLGLEGEEVKNKKRSVESGFSSGNKIGFPSKHNERVSSILCPSQNLESVERNQLELMKKVDELRDQLNRTYAHSRTSNERLATNVNQREGKVPLYYNQNLPDQDMRKSYDVNFPRTYGPSKSMPMQGGFSRMPHSGNIIGCRHQCNCSCSNAHKEDLQCLQKLPPPNLYYNEGPCLAYPGQMCYSLCSCGPSSPERHLQSRYLRSIPHIGDARVLPYNHINRVQAMESPHHRERRQTVKRHYRPTAGGAPFIVCYSCLKLLYLPADAFLSGKRCHRLQCASCSKVLMFSLHRRTHIAPYSQNTVVPSPGDVDNCSSSASTRNSVFAPHVNGTPEGDPVSYSEDFRPSVCKSVSKKGEFTAVEGNKGDRKQPLRRLVKPSDSGCQSSNEARLGEQPSVNSARKGSPLHRLMGYSSVGRILFVSRD